MPSLRRSCPALTLPVLAAALLTAAALAVPVSSRAAVAAQRPLPVSAPPAGMPSGAPPAATAAEPALPAPPASVWPFGETWSRTEGSGDEARGADFWTDFVYDDHGAGFFGLPIGQDSSISDLAPTQGVYSYPTAAAHDNGADIFRTAVGIDSRATYWRVDWNTLADPSVPAAEWVWDDGTGSATEPWPANAGVSSTGVAHALFVSSRGAWLIDPATGARTDVSAGLTVDASSRSFVVRIPRATLPVSGSIRLRMGAGIANADGTAFAAPTKPVPSEAVLSALGPAGAPTFTDNLMNVTYRSYAQEPPVYTGTAVSDRVLAALDTVLTTGVLDQLGADGGTRIVQGNFWDEDHQADALASGDVSAFAHTITWSHLLAHDSVPAPTPTGYSNRWYVSPLDLGQGVVPNASGSPSDAAGDLRPNYLGRVQPYAVYVPSGYTGRAPTKLTFVLHSLGVNLNQYGALNPQLLQELCQDRDSICATTEGFGPDGWYFDEAEADYWHVWHALATSYRLDPNRTVVGGYSMGGWAAYKLGLEHPDLYAQAFALEGPPTCGVEVAGPVRESAGSGHCDADGLSQPLLASARWLPYSFTQGVADELVPVTSGLQQYQAFNALGYRYHFFLYPTEDHLVYATQDRFADVVASIGTGTRTLDPGHVTLDWYPDLTVPSLGIGATTAYWVSGLAARSTTPGEVATVDATSAGIPDPAVTVHRSGPTPVTAPTPGTRFDLAWTAGSRPAARDALALLLTDVADLTVDAHRAGLSCPAVTVTTDGPTVLHLTGLRDGDRTLEVSAGTHTFDACTSGRR
ncbi:MAG TPA: peptidase [Mycobacteriales bacterium]